MVPHLAPRAWLAAAVLVLFSLPSSPVGTPMALRAAAAPAYTNPVYARDFADPMVLRVGPHDYYAYGTATGWLIPGHEFPILHSTDLAHWRYVGDVFSSDPAWGSGDFWAPDVIVSHGIYYLYYTGLKGTHCVAVATARTPTGPFTTRGVIGCGDATGNGYIDPAPLLVGNRAYLYISVDNPEHNISVIPLTSDLLHAAGARRRLFGITQAWEHGQNFSTVEGPFPLKHGKGYYLFYSGNDWNGNYAMGFATSTSPLGPYSKCACNPILRGSRDIVGPGGGSIVQGPTGRDWLVFHSWNSGGAEGYQSGATRVMMLEPVRWDGSRPAVTQPTNAAQPVP